jgi:hypothetical protein
LPSFMEKPCRVSVKPGEFQRVHLSKCNTDLSTCERK